MRHDADSCGTESTARRLLQQLPNVGPAVAGDLLRLGITAPAALAGQDPQALYERLCALDAVRHDPCLLDVFTAIVAQANGEPAQPWWVFSRQRKARGQGGARARPVATGSGRSVAGS